MAQSRGIRLVLVCWCRSLGFGLGLGWQWNVPPTARRIETKHDDDAQSQCVYDRNNVVVHLSLICLSRSLRDETRGRKEPALDLPKPASE